MSLRRRMVLFTAAAGAFAVVLCAVACYLAVRSNMLGRVDHQLRAQAAFVTAAPRANSFPIRRRRPGPAGVSFPRPSLQNQGDLAILSSSGAVRQRPGD